LLRVTVVDVLAGGDGDLGRLINAPRLETRAAVHWPPFTQSRLAVDRPDADDYCLAGRRCLVCEQPAALPPIVELRRRR
jgi:hypothetical protein